jgi:hypothetical protein
MICLRAAPIAMRTAISLLRFNPRASRRPATLAQDIHLGLRFGQRRAGPQPSHSVQVAGAGLKLRASHEVQLIEMGGPNLGFPAQRSKLEITRQDADNHIWLSVKGYGLAYDRRIAVEMATPEGVAYDDAKFARRVVIGGLEASAEHRLCAQEGEEIGGDARGLDLKRFVLASKVVAFVCKRSDAHEGATAARDESEMRI